jgi:hypothetical protein
VRDEDVVACPAPDLQLSDDEDPAHGAWSSAHVCFAVDDIAAMHERLSQAGVQFRSRPVAIGGGPASGWAVHLREPDGMPLELAQDDHAFD